LIGCQPAYIFLPVQSDYLENLWFDGVNVKFKSLQVYGDPKLVCIELLLMNDDKKAIIINDKIEIFGEYFNCYRVDNIALDDLSTNEVDGIVLKNQPFQISLKESRISLDCFLEDKSPAKESFLNVIKNFSDKIKKEKFKVKLPTLVINGKEYEFETVDFVYKK
jgi:hypothetical protein